MYGDSGIAGCVSTELSVRIASCPHLRMSQPVFAIYVRRSLYGVESMRHNRNYKVVFVRSISFWVLRVASSAIPKPDPLFGKPALQRIALIRSTLVNSAVMKHTKATYFARTVGSRSANIVCNVAQRRHELS